MDPLKSGVTRTACVEDTEKYKSQMWGDCCLHKKIMEKWYKYYCYSNATKWETSDILEELSPLFFQSKDMDQEFRMVTLALCYGVIPRC